MYRDIPEDLRRLIEPVVEDHGCELVDVESNFGGGRRGLLRVTVDGPNGDGRVPVDSCANISREIETQLDAADAIPGSYHLEVTSPGLDRHLAREKDFAAACGQLVEVRTRRPLDGRRRFKGKLVAFQEEVARIEVDGTELSVPFGEIERANSRYQFSRADFSGENAPADLRDQRHGEAKRR